MAPRTSKPELGDLDAVIELRTGRPSGSACLPSAEQSREALTVIVEVSEVAVILSEGREGREDDRRRERSGGPVPTGRPAAVTAETPAPMEPAERWWGT